MVGCSLVYKTFKRLFLFRCDSMHSIAKTCLPGCPDACRALLPFFPTCYHRVNPLRPPSFATAVAAHPLPFTLLPVKTASCLHFKLMDLPRRDKETEQGRGKESWDEKKRKKKKEKKERQQKEKRRVEGR